MPARRLAGTGCRVRCEVRSSAPSFLKGGLRMRSKPRRWPKKATSASSPVITIKRSGRWPESFLLRWRSTWWRTRPTATALSRISTRVTARCSAMAPTAEKCSRSSAGSTPRWLPSCARPWSRAMGSTCALFWPRRSTWVTKATTGTRRARFYS